MVGYRAVIVKSVDVPFVSFSAGLLCPPGIIGVGLFKLFAFKFWVIDVCEKVPDRLLGELSCGICAALCLVLVNFFKDPKTDSKEKFRFLRGFSSNTLAFSTVTTFEAIEIKAKV